MGEHTQAGSVARQEATRGEEFEERSPEEAYTLHLQYTPCVKAPLALVPFCPVSPVARPAAHWVRGAVAVLHEMAGSATVVGPREPREGAATVAQVPPDL
jgi:hypothetical protein